MSPKTDQTAQIKVKRRHCDEQFKRDEVALIEGGRGATQLARELGLSQWNLRHWKVLSRAGASAAAGRQARSVQQAGDRTASAIALAVEVADLRRELDAAARQCAIFRTEN